MLSAPALSLRSSSRCSAVWPWLIDTAGSSLALICYVMSGLTSSMIAMACIPGDPYVDLDAQRKPA